MALVGIIANPAASKDIRRLVAQGRVVPDWEKVNIVRRALLGLQSVGIDHVLAMPDSSHLVRRAADDSHLSVEVELLQMTALYNEGDTVRAAAAMAQQGVNAVITLGGDGTNRAVAKGARDIPMVAISTGTNNVFPVMVEGTTAGMAAGLVAKGAVPLGNAAVRSKTIAVMVDGEDRDIALVDVALSKERFVATRAIWDMRTIYEVFLTRAEPSSIGLSSIGARLGSGVNQRRRRAALPHCRRRDTRGRGDTGRERRSYLRQGANRAWVSAGGGHRVVAETVGRATGGDRATALHGGAGRGAIVFSESGQPAGNRSATRRASRGERRRNAATRGRSRRVLRLGLLVRAVDGASRTIFRRKMALRLRRLALADACS